MAKALTVGPRPRLTSTLVDAFRVNEDGALVTTDGLSRWYEAASRNQVFSVTTALAGAALAAANVAPPAAAAATVLSLLNPVGSGIDLEILQGWVFMVAATTAFGAGPWAWCGAAQGTRITAAEATAVKRSTRNAQLLSRVKAWSAATLTGGVAHQLIRPFPFTTFAAVAAATTAQMFGVDNVDGAIVVPPGMMVTLAPAAIGTGVTAAAGILYAEVPQPEGPRGVGF